MQSELRTNTSENVCLLLSLFDYFFEGRKLLKVTSCKLFLTSYMVRENMGYKWDINHVIQFSVYSQNQSNVQSA